MRDPRREPFGPYLRLLADKMGLRDWTVILDHGRPGEADCNAQNCCAYGRKVIEVRVGDDLLDFPPDRQRQTLVHELLHAHAAAMHAMLHRMLSGSDFESYALAMEYMVDGIAEEWARSLPLPDEVQAPSPKRKR